MQGTPQPHDALLDAEIKALLILLLLKSGTPSGEIQTALRLARGETTDSDQDEPSCPLAKPPSRPITPRQRIRNGYLAPLKCYAA